MIPYLPFWTESILEGFCSQIGYTRLRLQLHTPHWDNPCVWWFHSMGNKQKPYSWFSIQLYASLSQGLKSSLSGVARSLLVAFICVYVFQYWWSNPGPYILGRCSTTELYPISLTSLLFMWRLNRSWFSVVKVNSANLPWHFLGRQSMAIESTVLGALKVHLSNVFPKGLHRVLIFEKHWSRAWIPKPECIPESFRATEHMES